MLRLARYLTESNQGMKWCVSKLFSFWIEEKNSTTHAKRLSSDRCVSSVVSKILMSKGHEKGSYVVVRMYYCWGTMASATTSIYYLN